MYRSNSYTQYYFAQETAYNVLLKYSDGNLPVNPFEIIKKIKNIKLMTYSELATELQKKNPFLSIEEIIDSFESERGFLKKKGKKKYILAYNEKDFPTIYTWTIFHELGHYFLEHLLEEGDVIGLNSSNIKDNMEKEANCFARHCSSPLPVIKEVIDITGFTDDVPFLFYLMFGMGDGAIKICSEHFEKYSNCYDSEKYKELINKFDNSIQNMCKYIWSIHGIT